MDTGSHANTGQGKVRNRKGRDDRKEDARKDTVYNEYKIKEKGGKSFLSV